VAEGDRTGIISLEVACPMVLQGGTPSRVLGYSAKWLAVCKVGPMKAVLRAESGMRAHADRRTEVSDPVLGAVFISWRSS
jgi:hypothetical protein